jgi:hypothetical protein
LGDGPQVLVQDPKVKEAAKPTVQYAERPKVAVSQKHRDRCQLQEKGAHRESTVISVNQAKKRRAEKDEKNLFLTQPVDSFQVADHDAQRQELLDNPPDRVKHHEQQHVWWEAEGTLQPGVDGQECAGDYEEDRSKCRGRTEVTSLKAPVSKSVPVLPCSHDNKAGPEKTCSTNKNEVRPCRCCR